MPIRGIPTPTAPYAFRRSLQPLRLSATSALKPLHLATATPRHPLGKQDSNQANPLSPASPHPYFEPYLPNTTQCEPGLLRPHPRHYLMLHTMSCCPIRLKPSTKNLSLLHIASCTWPAAVMAGPATGKGAEGVEETVLVLGPPKQEAAQRHPHFLAGSFAPW